MSEDEFVNIMKEKGWNDEYIQAKIKEVNDARDDGLIIPFEICIIGKPIIY